VIVGAGHIARALAAVGDRLGWSVVVVDDRSDYADPRFFPEAARVECVAFADAFERVSIDPVTAVTLVTRGHKHDEECLRALVSHSPFYIGMIGSRRRVMHALSELHAGGVSQAFTNRIFAPVGLPVGARTPGEIALAIAAEIVAVRRGRRDWARREKKSYYNLP
jgi:xanthine dehydrogenase accessory factor